MIPLIRYKKPEERESLNQAMRVLLPLIHQRCLQLMPDQSEAAVAIQKQILKCFYALIQVCRCDSLQNVFIKFIPSCVAHGRVYEVQC